MLLIDEVHNLVEQGREMFSAVLCKRKFSGNTKKVAPYNKSWNGIWTGAGNRQLLELTRRYVNHIGCWTDREHSGFR